MFPSSYSSSLQSSSASCSAGASQPCRQAPPSGACERPCTPRKPASSPASASRSGLFSSPTCTGRWEHQRRWQYGILSRWRKGDNTWKSRWSRSRSRQHTPLPGTCRPEMTAARWPTGASTTGLCNTATLWPWRSMNANGHRFRRKSFVLWNQFFYFASVSSGVDFGCYTMFLISLYIFNIQIYTFFFFATNIVSLWKIKPV